MDVLARNTHPYFQADVLARRRHLYFQADVLVRCLSQSKPEKNLNEFDEVVLTSDIPELALKSGDVCTIVQISEDGNAFDVEFIAFNGDTVATTTLNRQQLRPIRKSEIPHVRAIDTVQQL